MKNSRTTLLPYAGLALATLMVTPSFAEIPPLAGTVTHVFGTATLRHGLNGETKPVHFRDKVYLKDTITTNEESVVRVLMGNKALVTISEMSVLTITEEVNHATLDIESGTIGLSVARKRMNPGEYIEIRTPHAVAAIRGTKVVTEVANRHESRMTVIEGKADMFYLRSDRKKQFPMLTNHIFEFNQTTSGKTRLKRLKNQKRKFLHARSVMKSLHLAKNVNFPAEEGVVKKHMLQTTELANQMVSKNHGKEIPQQIAYARTEKVETTNEAVILGTDEIGLAPSSQSSDQSSLKSPPSTLSDGPQLTPQAATPTAATPTAATPKVATPKVATPKVATPKVGAPKVAAPRVAAPRVASAPKASPKKWKNSKHSWKHKKKGKWRKRGRERSRHGGKSNDD